MNRRQLIAISGLLVAVIAAFAYLQLNLAELSSARTATLLADYLARFWPINLGAAYWHQLGHATLETLAMSAVGTLAAALLAAVIALPAAGKLGPLAYLIARGGLNLLRAIPELVWALLMVLAAGLGPNAGTLALMLHTTGVLGRLFAEALENTPTTPAQALRHSGSSATQAFLYGTLPNLWPQWLAYSLYRWENNIRMASVLGFVGAGGLGQMLYVSLSLFQEANAASVMLCMLALVVAVDSFSRVLRLRWVIA
ncbi:phosphonate ABC transporter, permease protein PhnE [Atopomonas sediminilitoris]|uniref:phosphonate ABC transporter, permease protein PhnE n=1 Tax=Atopomonas sediminilitoris TaxID=2919919 RepID=UPI001F4DEC85|nr:phosphonate ABC transporter, permease protein PhnE [Atopomonas sediminilitoris]MCJ8169626.1 phosphonate ABC transporter, permease protein PhnE [Atopomonas sediminilitoris]